MNLSHTCAVNKNLHTNILHHHTWAGSSLTLQFTYSVCFTLCFILNYHKCKGCLRLSAKSCLVYLSVLFFFLISCCYPSVLCVCVVFSSCVEKVQVKLGLHTGMSALTHANTEKTLSFIKPCFDPFHWTSYPLSQVWVMHSVRAQHIKYVEKFCVLENLLHNIGTMQFVK